MTRTGRDCLFHAAVAALLLQGAYPAAAAALSSSSTSVAVHICQSRTINYITHTLPQQCLKTGWVGATALALDEGPGIDSEAVVPGAAGRNTSLDVHPRGSGEETVSPATLTTVDAATTSAEPPQVASSQASPPTLTVEGIDQETEALLDGANFLSFEEWKKQNLERLGQSGENIGDRRQGHREHKRRPAVDNMLDSLGEDSEIELDFGGFVSGESGTNEPSPWSAPARSRDGYVGGASQPDGEDSVRGPTRSRPRDAGKAYAERFNYASFDCAATVLKTNPECKASSSILVENKDSYMLNECGARNKFLIIELCNDILVGTIVLANFEFFSSMFRSFRVSVSDRYPTTAPDRWRELGVFEARNSRGVQAFVVRNSLIWARYLRVEFLTHYGNEFYCPVSLLRVHGTTMMEELKHEDESAREAELEIEGSVKDAAVAENATPDMHNMPSRGVQEPLDQGPSANLKGVEDTPDGTATVSTGERGISSCDRQITVELNELFYLFSISDHLVCKPYGDTEKEQTDLHHQAGARPRTPNEDTSATPTPAVAREAPPPPTTVKEPAPASGKPAQAPKSTDAAKDTALPTPTDVPTKSPNNTYQDGRNPQASTTSPPPASPTTQESFFKMIHKRLQLLEANATLSLQYIEEQSRILRDAFVKIEKRQLTKTTNFLENLNTTVVNELKSFRQMYDLLWQSTVIELETQRELSQREILAISARLSILADEVIFQKRMSIVQSIILLLCLGLVLFSRYPATASYLELPILQSMLARSHTPLPSPYGSAPSSPRSALSARPGRGKSHFGHSRQPSDESTSSLQSAPEFSPLTPPPGTTYGEDTDGRRQRAGSSPPSMSLERIEGLGEMTSIPGWTHDPSGTRNPITWRGPGRREGLLSPKRTPDRNTAGKLSPLWRQETQEEAEAYEGEETDRGKQGEGDDDDDRYDDTQTENEFIRPGPLSPTAEDLSPPPTQQ
ncbi:MAG: hypothetical protein M1840_008822 [Geoglossum simile]|nr:MAG: hypothetical protein M1840_008822 [Geoglossum simile]